MPRRSAALLTAVVAVLAALSVVPAGPASAVVPSGSSTASPVVPRTWGVTLPGVPGDLGALDALSASVGRSPGVVMWYVAWSPGTGFPAADAAAVAARGAVPEITWEPWNPADGIAQPTYALTRIARGAFDKYLRTWAHGLVAYGRPVRLRFAHEMNGNWYPWAEGVNGNPAGSYVAAWRHVRSVFAAAGVQNVTWVWSPNVPYPGSVPLAQVFPGDASVDAVALDGYNWGSTQPGSSWTSFHDVFAEGLDELAALSARPVDIGEVGCAENGDGGAAKAAWIDAMWADLAAWPQVRGLTWFDFDKEADWRIDSTAASLSAFSSGVDAYLGG